MATAQQMMPSRAREKRNVLCLVFSLVRKPNVTCCDRFSHA